MANHVIVARGPTWRRQWPAFYHLLETAAMSEILHAWDLFDNPDAMLKLHGNGVIVGGGLTSAHLCVQLAARGKVDLLIRRERHLKQYDLDLYWMGYGRREQRKKYVETPVEDR